MLMIKVKNQLTDVAAEAPASLHISEMYSHTIGPGPNSKAQTNIMTIMSSRFELPYAVAIHMTTRQMMQPI